MQRPQVIQDHLGDASAVKVMMHDCQIHREIPSLRAIFGQCILCRLVDC